MKKFFGMLCLAVLFAATGEARGAVITFDTTLGNQSVPASWQTDYDTPFVDVQIQSIYKTWDQGYNDLTKIAYSSTTAPFVIDFTPIGVSQVTLSSFDLGSFGDIQRSTSYKIFDLSDLNNPVFDSGPVNFAYSTTSHPTYTVNYKSFAGIRLELQADIGESVGIDNINYSAAAVPEPVTMMIWGIGACGMGLVARRKKNQTV